MCNDSWIIIASATGAAKRALMIMCMEFSLAAEYSERLKIRRFRFGKNAQKTFSAVLMKYCGTTHLQKILLPCQIIEKNMSYKKNIEVPR